MSSAAVAIETEEESSRTSERAPSRWAELLLVGGITPFLFLLSWLLRRLLGLDDAELGVSALLFYGAYVINDPHFAVTYLLFYKDVRARAWGAAFNGQQRALYLLAGLIAPLALALWCSSALVTRSAVSLGLLIQLMFLLVGWHYVKQAFGMLMVLCARRGIGFLAHERLAILAHCYAAWAYAWASPFERGRRLVEKGVIYTALAHPKWLLLATWILLLSTIPPLAWLLFQKWRRERTAAWGPLLVFLCSVWLWTIYTSLDPLVRYAIPALHSVQYLYFVWLMKSNEAREREAPPFFEPSVAARISALALTAVGLGWILFHGLPSLLDDTLVARGSGRTDLGATPYFAALYAFVNIHHYAMDAVLWRRDNPLTRYLRS